MNDFTIGERFLASTPPGHEWAIPAALLLLLALVIVAEVRK